jgi:hypothetical protein
MANAKRRGVGIDDEVPRPEESLQCARVLASPRLSTLERPWPVLNVSWNAGSRQNNFAESVATTFYSTRGRGRSVFRRRGLNPRRTPVSARTFCAAPGLIFGVPGRIHQDIGAAELRQKVQNNR